MTEFAPFLSSLWNSIERFPHARWKSALSYGQLKSKEWLIQEANKVFQGRTFATAFVIGGWYGLLPALWKQNPVCPVQRFRSIDVDDSCREIAESVNRKWVIDDWQFKATTADALNMNYARPEILVRKANGDSVTLYDAPDLIVNTCCEHFAAFSQWLTAVPTGTPLVLQSNDLKDPEHVAGHASLADFAREVNLSQTLFTGELALDGYTRFMVIGIK